MHSWALKKGWEIPEAKKKSTSCMNSGCYAIAETMSYGHLPILGHGGMEGYVIKFLRISNITLSFCKLKFKFVLPI